jgi:tRNA(Ile)-lysidine synthase
VHANRGVRPLSQRKRVGVRGKTEKSVSAAEFSKLIARLGPFEDRPHLAVAVSGGADSMALLRLAALWARARKGKITALTVDHRLRTESAAEARQVARWCRTLGVAHVVLSWEGVKPATGIQAAARAARYGLLEDWCVAHGVLHLLVAHHADDQAETTALRRERGSGEDGLAGMAAIVETRRIRILRPLLGVPKARLIATLIRARQGWIEDPSNRDPRFARARLRAAKAPRRVLAYAKRRNAREAQVAELLAGAWVHPSGWAEADEAALAAAGPDLGRRALARLLQCVGGAEYPPATEKLEALWRAVTERRLSQARTLAFCRIQARKGRLVIALEPGRAGVPRRAMQPLAPARFCLG